MSALFSPPSSDSDQLSPLSSSDPLSLRSSQEHPAGAVHYVPRFRRPKTGTSTKQPCIDSSFLDACFKFCQSILMTKNYDLPVTIRALSRTGRHIPIEGWLVCFREHDMRRLC